MADRDAVGFDAVDWSRVRGLDVTLEPELTAEIRASRRLRRVTLGVGAEPIEEARRIAARSGVGYKTILHRWLIQGACVARTQRLLRRRHPAPDQ